MLGKIIKGRYRIVQILGSSNYCQTYLARDLSKNQLTSCVIKHLLPASETTNSLSSLRRLFTREIAALEKLTSYPQVPQLLDYFEKDQEFYLVQEYIAGKPLDRLMPLGVRWSESQVIELLHEVLGILEIVHSHGLIHRDLKPSNIIRREADGLLVLIDFGSVKQAWTQVVTSCGQTNANYAIGIPATLAIGTSGYMPCEQSRGRPRPNSDIYALGMIGIQALTGMPPTRLLEDSETGEVIWQHLVAVSPELAVVLSQMVRYHFSERYQSATEALDVLAPLVARYTPEAVAPEVQPDVIPQEEIAQLKTPQRRSVGSWLGITVGVAAVLTLLLGCYYALRPTKNDSPAIAKSQIATERSNLAYANVSVAQTLTGHDREVWTVAMSRDGRTLVSGSGDKTIKFWDLNSGQLLRTLSGNTAEVLSVALSQDGQTLTSASFSAQEAIKIWHLPTQELHLAGGNTSKVWSVALSPDGKTLVSSNGDKSIKIWHLPTRTLRHTLWGHSDTVWSVAVSNDGNTLVSGSKDRTIKVWDLRTGVVRRTLSGHSGRVRSVAISPDGQTLASSSWDKTIKIWNLRTGELLRTLTGHSDYVNSVTISPDNKIIASGSDDRKIKLWNLNTGALVKTLSGHSGNVNCVIFNRDGRLIISGGADKTIRVWQLQKVDNVAVNSIGE
jgi:WD40 repeat protein